MINYSLTRNSLFLMTLMINIHVFDFFLLISHQFAKNDLIISQLYFHILVIVNFALITYKCIIYTWLLLPFFFSLYNLLSFFFKVSSLLGPTLPLYIDGNDDVHLIWFWLIAHTRFYITFITTFGERPFLFARSTLEWKHTYTFSLRIIEINKMR